MPDKKSEITKKLDTIIALLAIQNKERDEQVKILRSLGFSSREIEKITGIPSSTVRGMNVDKPSGRKKSRKAKSQKKKK